jgi:hypothetical protein
MHLEGAVREAASAAGWSWLAEGQAEVAVWPEAVRVRFPAVGRAVGRSVLTRGGAAGPYFDWTVDDAVRSLLLDALGSSVAAELEGLYRHGDTAERRGVLRWIGLLPDGNDLGVDGLARELVDDALRSNDLRLVAAALGPWAVRHLDDAAFNQAVLKCLFVGLPPSGIDGLDGRVTSELCRMLAGYVHERVAAGRDVPAEVWDVIDRYPPAREVAAIEAELTHPVAERRHAARATLADRSRRLGVAGSSHPSGP